MKRAIKYSFLSLLGLPLFILSCSSGEEESAIAKQITLGTSKVAIVLPNDLSFTAGQTCNAEGVTGPRVRLRASIKWEGEGDLLPLVIRLTANDNRIGGEYAGSLGPSDDDQESLAGIFDGITTDYIPSGSTTYSTSSCFLDYGSLPEPTTELKGTSELEVPVTVSMMGVVRDSSGNDTPFVKEVDTTITYVAGSVPAD